MDQETASYAAAPDSRGKEQQCEEVAAPAAAVAGQCRGGGAAVAVPRRERWFDEEPPTTTAAGRAGWRCRSCAAVAIADCVALGCCPCAVVSLLGLALVKAPLVVGRRCVGRLRSRRRVLRHKKRVREVAAASATAAIATAGGRGKGAKAEAPSTGAASTTADAPISAAACAPALAPAMAMAPGQAEAAELAWLDEMYRVGHWGFGRVSFSGKTTP